MNIYKTVKNEIVVTNSTAKTSIEEGNLDRTRVPAYIIAPTKPREWTLTRYFQGRTILLNKGETVKKLIVPLKRNLRIVDNIDITLEELYALLDKVL